MKRSEKFAWLLLTSTLLHAQGRPPEMPKHLLVIATGAQIAPGATVAIQATSRRAIDPARPGVLDGLRQDAINAARMANLSVVNPATATLTLEIVDEPHQRWGMFHSQNNPYVYLLLRDRASAHLLYCAYQRAGFIHSAHSVLLDELIKSLKRGRMQATGDMNAFARDAMRPVDVEL